MKIKAEKKRGRISPGIFSLTNRSIVFFSSLLLVAFVFYITGSLNQFQDTTLLFILRVVQVLAVLDIVFCLASIVQSIFLSVVFHDIHYVAFVLPVILALVLSVVCFVFSGALAVLFRGT